MDKMNRKQWISLGITAFSVVAGAILLFFVLSRFDTVATLVKRIFDILRPIQYGLILTFLLLPVHRCFMGIQMAFVPRKHAKNHVVRGVTNTVALLLSLAFAALVVYGLLALLIPQLYLSVVGFVVEVPGYAEEIQEWLVQYLDNNPDVLNIIMRYYDSFEIWLMEWLNQEIIPHLSSIDGLIDWMKSLILPNLSGVVSNVYAVLLALILTVNDLFIGIVVTIYLLARKDVFGAQTKKIVYSMFRTPVADRIVEETRDAYRILSGFIVGKLLDSFIVGVIALVCCNWLDFPYPVLLATIIGVTNVIPFFGPFIGAVPCSILVLLVDPMQLLYFLLFVLALQQFDGNILGPKILGESTGLAGFWVIFAILLFGGLFGVTGMLLGVPVFAMGYNLANKLVCYGLAQRGLPVDTENYIGRTNKIYRIKE